MKGELLNTNDSVIGIAKCCNGNLGVVIKMTPYPSDMVDLKNNGLDGIQYKIVPFEMPLTMQGNDFVDSNENTWKILDCNSD